jgi:hypothetical protein
MDQSFIMSSCLLLQLNNSTADRHCYSAISSLERSTPVDAFGVFDHQNPTNIDEDTTILAIIIRTQFHLVPLFSVKIEMTQQPLIQFTPTD